MLCFNLCCCCTAISCSQEAANLNISCFWSQTTSCRTNFKLNLLPASNLQHPPISESSKLINSKLKLVKIMKRRAASNVESQKSDSSRPSTSRSASSSNIQVSQRAKRYNYAIKLQSDQISLCCRKRSGFLGDDSCIENAGTKRRKLRKRVTRDKEEEDNEENLDHKEILDDMGLNILSDNSNSCDTMQHPHNSRSQVSIVQNIIVLLFRTNWSLETSLFWEMKYFDASRSFWVSKVIENIKFFI